ncbi:MAG: type II toxin-antitoxin system HipA family toxin [Devosia sp.]
MKQVDHILSIDISLQLKSEALPVGRMAWRASERRSYFEYAPAALDSKLDLSPFKLPLRAGAQAAPNSPFEGLHGLFNDSLPDGWGRKLLDRRLQKMGYDFASLGPMDRLTFVGTSGMGALHYQPVGLLEEIAEHKIDLDWLAGQAELVQDDAPEADIDRLQAAQGGSGGVRPKIVIGLDPNTRLAVSDRNAGLPAGYEPWIVKFRSETDPAEIGTEEYAYSLMAKAAGVEMAETKLLKGSTGNRYFATKRFDRGPGGPVHIHTLSGLLQADHRAPEVDYGSLLKATRLLTRDERHVERMFGRMVFNVLARNRDDHSKNHAFQRDSDGTWSLTPAYDLTFSLGPGGEHNMAIAGEGRNPGHRHIMQEAKAAGVNAATAQSIYDEVKAAVDAWPSFAETAGLSQQRTAELDTLLNDRGPAPKVS